MIHPIDQPDLFTPPPDDDPPPSKPRTLSLDERFAQFDRENPHVYEALEQLAKRRIRAGDTYISIALLFEELRGEPALTTTGRPFKMNNSYRSYYARLLIQRVPALKDVIRTRDLRAKGAA